MHATSLRSFPDPLPAPGKALILSTGVSHNGIRVAKDLHAAACPVVVHCSQHNLACALPGIPKLHPRRGVHPAQSVLSSLRREHPALVIPCDDDATRILHHIHANHPEWRPLIERSLGSAAAYSAIDSRSGLMQSLAGLAAVSLPDWALIRSLNDLRAFQQRIGNATFVLKLEHSAGGVGVRIVRNPMEAVAAFHQLTHPFGPIAQLGRRLRDFALNIYPQRPSTQSPTLIAQRYIQGTPANTAIFCRNGEVLASISLESLSSLAETTPSATVRRTRSPHMEEASRAIAGHLRLSGFHGLDFLIEDNTAIPWLLELNPRVTPAAHLPLGPGHDLITACVAQLDPGSVYRRLPIPQPIISFFPRQVAINPDSPYFRMAYHDVDWTAPHLIQAHLRRLQGQDLVARSRRLIAIARARMHRLF